MLKIKKVVLPVDHSARCLSAADSVRALATRADLEVTVLRVRDERPHPRANQEVIRAFHERLAGLNVRFIEVRGDPAQRIIEYTRDHATDLVVMPTRALGFVDRLLLGSVTERVLRGADCPVWTGALMEPAFGPWPRIASVVAGVDLGPQSRAVLRWAADFADDFGAHLTVIHTNTQLVPATGIVHDPEWRSRVAQVLRSELLDLVASAGVKAEIRLSPGGAAKALASSAQGMGADVLVIGRSARSLAARFRSQGFDIIRRAPCAVVSVDPAGRRRPAFEVIEGSARELVAAGERRRLHAG